ncbi:TPA: hypothetical protein ENX78_12460 [Candidatus Poribacteria bacterium]|nr:hypothetical protein [Candidatus Poribacteria bacterium]
MENDNVDLIKKLETIGLPLLVLILLILSVIIRILPYLTNNYFFEVGFDTGFYQAFLRRFAESNNWDRIPFFPYVWDYESFYIEPGFFGIFALILKISNYYNLRDFFRFVLPILFGILIPLAVFALTRHVSSNRFVGVLSSSLIALSYVQYNAINESYYRQIVASFILIVAILGFEITLKNNSNRGIIYVSLLGGSLYVFHRPIFALFILSILVYIIINTMRRRTIIVKKSILILISSLILSAIFWFPVYEQQIDLITDVINNSKSDLIAVMSDQVTHGGGAKPLLMRDGHILLTYASFSPVLVAFSLIGMLFVFRHRSPGSFLVCITLVTIVYMMLCLVFSNRYVFNLDIFICCFCGIGVFYLARWLFVIKRNKRIYSIILVAFILALLVIPFFNTAIKYQSNVKPYITKNLEGVYWIEEFIDRNGSVLFAPDYLSADLIQLGYTVAMYDYYLAKKDAPPIFVTEEFIVNAPSNLTYVEEFFKTYPDYRFKEIYVLWGSWELEAPLVYTKKKIPLSDYLESKWFVEEYSGVYEIRSIYKLNITNINW